MNNPATRALDYPLAGFPQRPADPLVQLTPANVLAIVNDLEADDHIIQPKLNGDRVLLQKLDGSMS